MTCYRYCPILVTRTLVLATLTATSAAQPPTPSGDQFQINQYTISCQFLPVAAPAADGGFLAVWESCGSSGSDNSSDSIQLRRIADDGALLGGEFQVNSYTTGYQSAPEVAALQGGDFVIAWSSYGSPGSDQSLRSLQIRRIAANGSPADDQFQLNTYTPGDQLFPSIAAAPSGELVVVWQSSGSAGSDTSLGSIQARRVDADGSPIGDDFQVNAYTTDEQFLPDVAADGDGRFLVVWTSFGSPGSDNSSSSIQGRRFDSSGMPLGADFQVNTFTAGVQRYPAVSALAGGGFVVSWFSYGSAASDTAGASIQGRRFDGGGSPIGDDFQINSFTPGNQSFVGLDAAPDGGFLVTWQSEGSAGSDTSQTSIQMRSFGADGSAGTEDFQLNIYTPSFQTTPKIATADGHRVLAIWTSDGSAGTDTDGRGIQGRLLLGARIFGDGFESGDTAAWPVAEGTTSRESTPPSEARP